MTAETKNSTTEASANDANARLKREAEERERDRDNVREQERKRFLLGITSAIDTKWATVTEVWHRLCVNGPYESLVASIVDMNMNNEFKTPSEFLDYYCFYGGSDQVGMAGMRELHGAIRRDPFDPKLFEDCLDRAYVYYLQSRGPRVLNDEECAAIDAFVDKAKLSAEEKLVFEIFHGLKHWRRPIADNDSMVIYGDSLSYTAEALRLPEEKVRSIEREAGVKVRKSAGGYASPLRELRGWRFHVIELVHRAEELDSMLKEFLKYCAERIGVSREELMEQFIAAKEEKPEEATAPANPPPTEG